MQGIVYVAQRTLDHTVVHKKFQQVLQTGYLQTQLVCGISADDFCSAFHIFMRASTSRCSTE
jgi:hypothetical protein